MFARSRRRNAPYTCYHSQSLPSALAPHKMRLWALWLCAACLAAELWIAHSKTHRFADQAEAKREALLLKQQVPEPFLHRKLRWLH